MTLPLPTRLRGWRAALLLVVVACATPGRAAAECGDHVTVLAPGAARSDGSMAPAADTPELPPAPKPPCSGPNCSRGPDHHAPSAPAPAPAPHGKAAVQTLRVAEPPEPPAARVWPLTSPLPVRRATSIFHPPRVG